MIPSSPSKLTNFTTFGSTNFKQVWRASQPAGIRSVVANADHGIADEAPDVVVDAVCSVVDQSETCAVTRCVALYRSNADGPEAVR